MNRAPLRAGLTSDGTLRCCPFDEGERQELNVLKSHLRITIQTLLQAGKSQREIERVTGVDRKTIEQITRQLLSKRLVNRILPV